MSGSPSPRLSGPSPKASGAYGPIPSYIGATADPLMGRRPGSARSSQTQALATQEEFHLLQGGDGLSELDSVYASTRYVHLTFLVYRTWDAGPHALLGCVRNMCPRPEDKFEDFPGHTKSKV